LTAAEQKEGGKFMNEQTKLESKLDDLTKTTDPGSTELTAEELEQVSGGQGTPNPANPCCT
jgi:bacteriocin-like protein